MIDEFENHCWKDVVPPEVLDMYRHYKRELRVGPNPALVAVDLYELAYEGGPLPVNEVTKTYPSSCGEYAWAAIPPTQRMLAAARAAGVPIFYTTTETKSAGVRATQRRNVRFTEEMFAIRPEFAPQENDIVIRKSRASAFFGTPLAAHLVALGVRSLIMLGESTSGCLRASAVEGYSHGFHVTLVEECCYDRSLLSHKINLFDLHHKYADVMGVEQVVAHLQSTRAGRQTA